MKTKQHDAVKFYRRRDSATTLLRKMGVKPSAYNTFISKTEDGRFACQVALAETHLQLLAVADSKPKRKARKNGKRVTISGMCRKLILDGKTNKEIFALLQEKFGEERINEGKQHYPAWYRCELRRKGQLPPAFDHPRREKGIGHIVEEE